jgi:hypothetical protein
MAGLAVEESDRFLVVMLILLLAVLLKTPVRVGAGVIKCLRSDIVHYSINVLRVTNEFIGKK